jgi:sepiapterin reductase
MTRYLLVVTGASRGLGRAICQAFYEQAATPSRSIARCCLIARSTAGLEATRQSLLQQPLPIDQPSTITMHEIDLGAMETLEERWQQMLDGLMPTDYDHVVLINNAGTVGPIGPVLTESPLTTTLQDLQQTVDLNLTSLLWTTTVWGRWAIQHNLEATLVNISSLAALHPFPTMALYAAGKAVRR